MLTSFYPGAIWPDTHGTHINAHGGGILAHEGVYFWFGEHKIEGRAGNRAMVGVHCYASQDLYNWEDLGIALSVSDDPDSDITRGCVIERPKVIYNAGTGAFVMWFHLELKGQGYRAARSGVAVSDRVAGPYTFVGSFRPNAGAWPMNATSEQMQPPDADLSAREFEGGFTEDIDQHNILGRDFAGGQMARDMTLFVDEDGAAYHVFASEENSTLHISLLSDDYLEPAGKYARVFEGRFMEAPALCKRQGRYYFIGSGCTGWAPNAARSAVADSMWGPWTELGNSCVGENSEITFSGQSTYILPVVGKQDAFIAMFDLWRPENAIDGRYMWLPVEFEGERIVLRYRDAWDLSVWDS
ncbi:MAG TPA: glycoside hydrolase family 43 protein [Anaerolineales bacterium]|nr:glycoside hydrolase family 43 protein [Anaerolineales bacterium]